MQRDDEKTQSLVDACSNNEDFERTRPRHDGAITKRIFRVSIEFIALLIFACLGSAGYLSTTWEKEVSTPQRSDDKSAGSTLVEEVLDSAPLTGSILQTQGRHEDKRLTFSRRA